MGRGTVDDHGTVGGGRVDQDQGVDLGSRRAPRRYRQVRTLLGPKTLDSPGGIALDTAGDLFVADTGHCRVLVLPDHSGVIDGLRVRAGHVAVLAGGRAVGGGADRRLARWATRPAWPSTPTGTSSSPRPRRSGCRRSTGAAVAAWPMSRPSSSTVAGTGTAGFNGDGLTGTASELDEPTGVAVDSAGDVFIADTANCRVRVLAAHDGTILGRPVTTGHLTTVAGTGVCGSAGQGGPLAGAELWNPVAVALDRSGDLFVADSGDQSVLLGSAAGTTGWGTTVAAGDLGRGRGWDGGLRAVSG